MTQPANNRWGIGIASLYIGFVLFILACVGYASLQHFDLVEPHYYEKTLVYQNQIDKLNRTAALAEKPSITFTAASRSVTLRFPDYGQSIAGQVLFYRPSVAAMDFARPLLLDTARVQIIADDRLSTGYWRAKLTWTMEAQEFFLEQDLLVP